MPRQGSASVESLCPVAMPPVPAPTMLPPVAPVPPEPLVPPDPAEPALPALPPLSSSELHATNANDARSAVAETVFSVRKDFFVDGAMGRYLVGRRRGYRRRRRRRPLRRT